MINLQVDESYAFDFLSILEVKLMYANEKQEHAQKSFNFYSNLIAEQVGDSLFDEIRESVEYKKLKESNQILFETIDNCKKYKMDAVIIDKLNYRRFQLKTELQKKFFNKSTNEFKLGYSK